MSAGSENVSKLGFNVIGLSDLNQLNAAVLNYTNSLKQLTQAMKTHQSLISGNAAATKQNTKNNSDLAKSASNTSKTVRDTGTAFEETNDKLDTHNKKLQTVTLSWQSIGRLVGIQLFHRSITALITEMQQAVQQAAELSVRVAEIQTIQQRANQSTLELTSSLYSLSDAWGLDILDQAEAAYQTVSNQVAKGAEAIGFLDEANKLAVTGIATTADSVNLLTSAINAFNLDVNDTDQIAASFFKTVELGRVRIEDMANTFGRVAVPANQLGLSLNELQAAITVATIKGVQFNESSTLIRNVLLKLIRPTGAMKDFIAELGFESGEAAVKTLGLGQFLAELETKTKGSSTEIGNLFGRIRAITGAMIFAGDGVQKFDDNLAQLENSTDSYNKATELILESTGKKFEIELNKIQNFFTQQGSEILEFVSDSTDGFKDITTAVKAFADVLKYTLPTAIGGATLYLAALNAPLTGAAIAIGGIIYALQAWKDKQAAIEKDIIESNKKILDSQIKQVKQSTDAYNRGLDDQLKAIRKQGSNIERAWFIIFNKLDEQYNNNLESAEKSFDAVGDSISKAVKAVDKGIKAANKSITDSRSNLQGFIKDIQSDIFEQSLIDISPADQFQRITEQLKRLDKERQDALKSGDIDVANQLLKEYRDLTKRQITLDREQYNNQQSLNEELRIEREKSAEELNKLQIDLFEARQTRDKKKEREVLAEISNKRKEDIKTIQGIEKSIAENRRSDLGQYFTTYESRLNGIKNIAIEQQKEIERQEEARLKRLSDLRIKLTARELDFESEYKKFKDFDLNKAIESAGGDAEKLNKIFAERQDNIATLQALSNKSLSNEEQSLTKRITLLTQQQKLEIENLKVQEQQRVNRELSKIQYNELVKQEEATLQILKNRRNEQAKLVEDQLTNLSNTKSAAQRLLATINDRDLRVIFKQDQFNEPFETSRLVIEERLNQYRKLLSELAQGNELTDEQYKSFSGLIQLIVSNSRELQRRGSFLGTEDINIDIYSELFNSINNISEINKKIKETNENISDINIDINERQKDIEEKKQNELFITAGINNINASTEEILKRHRELWGDIVNASREAANDQERVANALSFTVKELEVISKAQEVPLPPKPITKARGGQIYGTDSIPALLSPGEFVMNAASTRKFYSQLVNMNAQGIEGFARGGPTTNVGDINISMQSSGSTETDIVAIGRGLRREIRRGRIRLA